MVIRIWERSKWEAGPVCLALLCFSFVCVCGLGAFPHVNGSGLSPTASACSPPAVSPPSARRVRACPRDASENNASKVEQSRAKGESALPLGSAEKGASEEASNNKPPAQLVFAASRPVLTESSIYRPKFGSKTRRRSSHSTTH